MKELNMGISAFDAAGVPDSQDTLIDVPRSTCCPALIKYIDGIPWYCAA